MSLTTDPDFTVASVYESVEANLWLADSYFRKGSHSLGMECLRAAWSEYLRFKDELYVYSGDELGGRILKAFSDNGVEP